MPSPAPDPRTLLRQHFGFESFRDGQERVIDSLLAGRSALAVFPTGGGKSLCYQLPALALDGLTVVVSPLIALMKDQIDFLRRHGIVAARLDSTLSLAETRSVEAGMTDGSLKLLYVSPERFNNERFLGLMRRAKISLFAVDEAHCISEWGHNFRPDYLKLADTARELGVERALALTATATPAVAEDIRKAFRIEAADSTVTGFYRPNLRLGTTTVSAAKRDDLLLNRLQKRPPGPTIVYVTLQKTAERIAALIANAGFPAWAYHAGMENADRASVQDDWMQSDGGIVVATIAFGMGIDKANVRYVYHYNLPKSLESYSQEIGRAGRDGASSIVELFACPDDVPTLENFVYGDTPTESALRGLIDELLLLGPRFDVSLYDLSARHDIRQLVLRTVLTYLELNGILKQGTPFYAGYEFRFSNDHTARTVAAAFPGPAGELVRRIFALARLGRVWQSINPDEAATTLGEERRRIVRALEVMEERGMIELRTADARQSFTRLRPEENGTAITEALVKRFEARERAEIERLQQVLDLITLDGCQVGALVGYFGEQLSGQCGHCTHCTTGRRQKLPAAVPAAPLDGAILPRVASLRLAHPQALGDPRQAARFLCGLTSPALTKAKLTRDPLFGALEDRPFRDVLAWLRG